MVSTRSLRISHRDMLSLSHAHHYAGRILLFLGVVGVGFGAARELRFKHLQPPGRGRTRGATSVGGGNSVGSVLGPSWRVVLGHRFGVHFFEVTSRCHPDASTVVKLRFWGIDNQIGGLLWSTQQSSRRRKHPPTPS